MNLFLNKMFDYRSRIVVLLCCSAIINLSLYAQKSVSTIYGDEDGYFESSTSSKQNSTNSNNLIGFTADGITFSTGVNDAILIASGVNFTAQEFQAFTVSGDIDYGSANEAWLGVAAYWGGSLQNNSTSDYINSLNPIIPSYFMRDGINGLELGTNFFNIQAQDIIYTDIAINTTAGLDDAIPDIIATQTGAPSNKYDTFKFTNSSGVTIGNEISVVFQSIPIVGVTYWTIYRVNSITGVTKSLFAQNSPRDLRLLTFELSDFGIDASNLPDVTTFVHHTAGSTDIAFTAFNKESLSFIPVDLVLSSEVNLPTALCSTNSLEFVTTVYNSGSSNSSGFDVNMPIQAGLNYVSSNAVFSGGAGSASYNSATNMWIITGLEDGESVELTVDVSVTSLVLPLTYTNTISNMVEVDYDLTNNSVTISIDDSDCDEVYNSEDLDDDNDGILDVIEGEGDTDGDGIIDRLDLDSDNDGIYDFIEAGGDPLLDADNDGKIDVGIFVDINDNGVHDLYDPSSTGTAIGDDTDGDGVLDAYEWDSDNDGCADALEAGMSDGDGDTYLAEAPITVDEDGRVITSDGNNLVVGTNSYITPNDYNTNGVYDFQEVTMPLILDLQPVDEIIEENDDVTFSIGASTAEFIQWQVNDGYGWADVLDGGVYSGSTTAELTLSNPEQIKYDNYLFRVFLSSPADACGVLDTLTEIVRLNIDAKSGRDISGYIFSEQDIDNDIVDGNLVSQLGVSQLSVVLFDADQDTIVDIAPVVDGDYVFYDVSKKLNYDIALDTGLYTSTYVAHDHNLPSDWYYAGEIQNNASNTNTGNDGTIDGVFSLPSNGNSAEYVNFAVLNAPKSGNSITCFNDSTMAGWNPTLPAEKLATYTESLPWEYQDSGSDYPGDKVVVGCAVTQTVSYWVEWGIPYLSITYRDTCQQVFTYNEDLENPAAVCQDVTLYLDSTGTATLSVAEVDNGSSDNCSIDTMYLDVTFLDCDDVGTSTVVYDNNDDYSVQVDLYVSAINPDRASCSGGYNYTLDVAYDVVISGSSPPANLYTLQGNVLYDGKSLFFNLPNSGGSGVATTANSWTSDSNCNTVTPDNMGAYSFDVKLNGVNLPDQTLEVLPSSMGGVTLTVADVAGQTDYCTADITVLDTIAPWLTESLLDTLIASAVCDPDDPTFVDNCALETLTWEMTGATNGSSASTGTNYLGSTTFNEGITTITYTATDASGNTAVDSFDVVFSLGCLEYLSPTETGLGYGVYLIQSAADLICLSNSSIYWDKNIWQIVDIDLDADDDGDYIGGTWGLTDGTVTIDEGDWNMDGLVDASDDKGFAMIGKRYGATDHFTGSYQGASWDGSIYTLGIDRSIKDLFIDNSTVLWGYGLFAHADGAVIENIHLEDVNINAAGQVGALIGYAVSSTTVTNCSSSGLVVADGREVGGLIGYCNGIDVISSFSSCTVVSNTTTQDNAGALIGKANWGVTITNCWASGDVYGEYTNRVGGLVGFLNGADVEECYSTGYVQGNKFVGGLIGYNFKSDVLNSYSTGAVKGNEAVGAFAGVNNQSKFSYSYAIGNVAQSGATDSLGAFTGYATNSPVFTACYFDEETTGSLDSLLTDVGNTGANVNIDALPTSDFNNSSNFSFSSTIWSYDNNTFGRPYLAWQNDGTSDYNVSNPVPTLIANGFSQKATYLGTGILAQGLRYTNLDSLPESWIDATTITSTSGQTFTIEEAGLGDGVYYVQPYIIKADGSHEYGDMSCFKVADFPIIISSDSVTTITETTAKIYGSISYAREIVEYGFYYSDSLETIELVKDSATEVQVYSGVSSDFFDMDVTSAITGLANRAGTYFRLYVKSTSGTYTYGNTVRFISEQRDFSLELDGDGDALVVDEVSTANEISDWGAANNTFSFEFWMKKSSAITDKEVLLSNQDGVNGYSIYLQNGELILSNPAGETVATSLKIEDEEWHYAAVTYDAGNAIIYVDDSASGTQNITISLPVDNNCFIGANYDAGLGNEYQGYLDALRFWNVELTADQINELAYDNVRVNTASNTIEGVGTGSTIVGLLASNLTVSLGFNVKSTNEADKDMTSSFVYSDQDDLHDYPFFHKDVRLTTNKVAFNVVAIGNAKPSPYLPRVYWRADNTNDAWLGSANWSGYAYPGEGVSSNTYLDVSASALANDSAYCKYTILDVSNTSPEVSVTPPYVQVLVDREETIGTYHVDDSGSELTVLKGVYPELFKIRVDNEEGEIVIEEGSTEVD